MVKLALAKTVYTIFDSNLVLGKLKTEIDQKINTFYLPGGPKPNKCGT